EGTFGLGDLFPVPKKCASVGIGRRARFRSVCRRRRGGASPPSRTAGIAPVHPGGPGFSISGSLAAGPRVLGVALRYADRSGSRRRVNGTRAVWSSAPRPERRPQLVVDESPGRASSPAIFDLRVAS